MTTSIHVRKAHLTDAKAIADFVNSARASQQFSEQDVTERFGQVGFLLAEDQENIVGLIGWQVENLIIRVRDFLIAPGVNRETVGRTLVTAMEEEGIFLQAEAAILFLPANPSQTLVDFWRAFGYAREALAALPKTWREAAGEWKTGASEAMIKQLREDLVRKPM